MYLYTVTDSTGTRSWPVDDLETALADAYQALADPSVTLVEVMDETGARAMRIERCAA